MKLLGIVTILLFGCSSGTDPNLGDEFILKYGQSTSIEAQNISITFADVGDDSRCPTGAVCVWEGNAEILLRVISGDQAEVYALNTTLEPKQIEQDGYQLELISVSPYPELDKELTEGEYSITISVTQ